MTIFDSIILGLVQGLTEFIPVSSSGHLILAREFFNIGGTNDLAFDAILHLATALSILFFFRADILKLIRTLSNYFKINSTDAQYSGDEILDRKYFNALILGTIPAVLVGFFFEEFIENILRDTSIVIISLIVGSLVFLLAERAHRRCVLSVAKKEPAYNEINEKRGFMVGLFQAIALIPGISRSGITISGGFFMGLSRVEAVRFTFLLGLPVILGSGLKKLLDLYQSGLVADIGLNLIAGSIVAFLSGLWAISWLIRYLSGHTLNAFVWYRIALAVLVLFLI